MKLRALLFSADFQVNTPRAAVTTQRYLKKQRIW